MNHLYRLIPGDALTSLRGLPDKFVQCCVTSPPYFNLRSYLSCDHPDKLLEVGAESSPVAYVNRIVDVFREVRRVLVDDGLLFLNIGDSYISSSTGSHSRKSKLEGGQTTQREAGERPSKIIPGGLPAKNLMMIPARVAIALQDDGWILRSEIVWYKPGGMPESVTDRPTKSHEMVYMFAKNERYFYDGKSIAEPCMTHNRKREKGNGESAVDTKMRGHGSHCGTDGETKNARTVWSITHGAGYDEAHFATMPEELARRCVVAGSRPADIVLDPFAGSGTTLAVAIRHGRQGIGLELNSDYLMLAHKRICAETLNLFQAEDGVAA